MKKEDKKYIKKIANIIHKILNFFEVISLIIAIENFIFIFYEIDVKNILALLIFVYSLTIFFIVNYHYLNLIIYNKKISLENVFRILEKGYLKTWIIISIFYLIVGVFFILFTPFEKGIAVFFSVLGWGGTISYLVTAVLLNIADLCFCNRILRCKKNNLLFIKFSKSILTSIVSWLLIIIFVYNNSRNYKIPSLILILYITLNTIASGLYPLLDMYQYTFEELRKKEQEKEKREEQEKKKYKYDYYNYD